MAVPLLLADAAPGGSPWTFHPHPDVVAAVVVLGVGYVWAVRRWGPLFHPRPDEPAATARQQALFGLGLLSLWAAAGWPVHDLAEHYLYSAHMVQHILLGFVTPALLLMGTPRWLAEMTLGRGAVGKVYRRLARPLPATIVFNAALAALHWPKVVDLMLVSEAFHAAAHLVFFAAAVLMWSVVVGPLPETSSVSTPTKMLFLFVQTILPTVPASFLTFGDTVLYPRYETFPRLWGLSARDDMQLAGLLMKVGGGLLLWGIIAALFFRWASAEEATARGGRTHGDRAGVTPPSHPGATG